jgi:hypothetical protein
MEDFRNSEFRVQSSSEVLNFLYLKEGLFLPLLHYPSGVAEDDVF